MDILDILRRAQDGHAVDNLARTFNVDHQAADTVLKSVVPQLAQRIERNTLSRGGVADLVSALGRASGQNYLDNPQSLNSEAIRSDGVQYLDQILWGKDQSRALAAKAAQTSGVSEALIKQMLPVIAAMVMGGLAKGAGGGLADILSKIPGLPGGQPASGGGGLSLPQSGGGGSFGGATAGGSPLPLPGGAGGGGLSAPSGGGFGGQSPLPVPGNARPGNGGGWGGGAGGGGTGPFDDLSDVIRRGGQSIPGTGGGGLAGIIRSILGAVLGFQSRGVVSWIIRYVVMRYGWSILRTLASVVFGRRV